VHHHHRPAPRVHHHHRPVPRVHRPPPPPPRARPVARRRGRGRSDVHLGIKGQDIDENFVGIFTWFKAAGVDTQVRYSKFGNGAGITGFAARKGDSTFEVSSTEGRFEVLFDGKELAAGAFGENRNFIAKRKSDSKSDVILSCRGVFRASIVFDPVTKSLDVNLNVLDKIGKFKGIMNDGRGKSHSVTREASLFKAFVAFEKVSALQNPEWKELADKYCVGILPRWVTDCQKDVMMTGLDWSNNYRLEGKDRNDAMKKDAFKK